MQQKEQQTIYQNIFPMYDTTEVINAVEEFSILRFNLVRF